MVARPRHFSSGSRYDVSVNVLADEVKVLVVLILLSFSQDLVSKITSMAFVCVSSSNNSSCEIEGVYYKTSPYIRNDASYSTKTVTPETPHPQPPTMRLNPSLWWVEFFRAMEDGK